MGEDFERVVGESKAETSPTPRQIVQATCQVLGFHPTEDQVRFGVRDVKTFEHQQKSAEESPHRDLWEQVREKIAPRIQRQSYRTWFEPTYIGDYDGQRVVLNVSSHFFSDWLEEHYLALIEATFEEVLGQASVETDSICTAGYDLALRSLYEDREGNLWAGSAGPAPAILRYDGHAWRTIRREDGASPDAGSRLCQTRDGILWAVSEDGIGRFDGQRWTSTPIGSGRGFSSILQSRDGTLWVGGEGRLLSLRVFDGNAWRPVTQEELGGPITSLHATPDGGLWAGTRDFGALQFDGKTWTSSNIRHGLPVSSVSSIAPLDSSLAIVLVHGRGILRQDGQGWTPAFEPDLMAGVESLFQDRQGTVWLNRVGKTTRYLPDREPPETTLTLKPGMLRPPASARLEWMGQDPHGNTPQEQLQYSYRLDLSRAEAGKLRLNRTMFPLTEPVQEVVEGLQTVAQEKGFPRCPGSPLLRFGPCIKE